MFEAQEGNLFRISIIFQNGGGINFGSETSSFHSPSFESEIRRFFNRREDYVGNNEEDQLSATLRATWARREIQMRGGKAPLPLTFDSIKNKKSIIMISNIKDSMCLARSLIVSLEIKDNYLKPNERRNLIDGGKMQTKMATKLHKDAGVEIKEKGNDQKDIKTFADFLKHNVAVLDLDSIKVTNIFAEPKTDDSISILFVPPRKKHPFGHFHSITNLEAAMGIGAQTKQSTRSQFFCQSCKRADSSRSNHKCDRRCQLCFNSCENHSRSLAKTIECSKCNLRLQPGQCFENHKCMKWKLCDCDDFIAPVSVSKSKHV